MASPGNDALIVAGAAQADCAVLLSEDLQHGRRFGSLGVCGWRIRFGTSRPGGLPSSSAGWLVKGAGCRRCANKCSHFDGSSRIVRETCSEQLRARVAGSVRALLR